MAKTKRVVKAAAVYVRLSQDRSGKSLGIARQVELCEKEAAERGWQIAEIYTERNVSAYSRGTSRKVYDRMVADIDAGRRHAILAVDQDRLARRLAELCDLLELCEARRVPIVLQSGELDTTTADGVLRAHILGAVAENESSKKSERVKRQRAQAAKQGVFMGGKRPYGYEADGTTIRRDEAKVLREASRRLLAGESLRSVTMDFNRREIKTGRGTEWRPQNLREILSKPRLAGQRVHQGRTIGPAAWKAIIPPDQHARLVAVLNDPRRTPRRRGRPAERLLSGLCRCGKCGRILWHAKVNGVRAYRCPDKSEGGCNATTIVAEPLENMISQAVLQLLESSKIKKAITKRDRSPIAADDSDVMAIEAQLEELAAAYGTENLSLREWMAARDPLLQRREAALAALDADVDRSALDAFQNGVTPAEAWAQLDLDRRRTVLRLLIENITIEGALPGRNQFDATRVRPVWRA